MSILPTRRAVREAVRATRRASTRRSFHLLVLTAVAIPLVALAPAPAGAPVADHAGAPTVSGPRAAVSPVTVIPVTVSDGRTVATVFSSAATVLEVLDDLGVERGPFDRVVPQLLAPIEGPTVIRITRAEVVEDEVRTELPRQVVRLEDPTLLRGYARVVQQGRVGTRIDTQLALIVDGEEESRLTVASRVVREPRDRIVRVGTAMLPGETVWDAMARCEAGGRWDAVRMSGGRVLFSGGLQFTPRTWDAFKPDGFPELAADATREQQIAVAERVLARQGWGAWPSCSQRLGLR